MHWRFCPTPTTITVTAYAHTMVLFAVMSTSIIVSHTYCVFYPKSVPKLYHTVRHIILWYGFYSGTDLGYPATSTCAIHLASTTSKLLCFNCRGRRDISIPILLCYTVAYSWELMVQGLFPTALFPMLFVQSFMVPGKEVPSGLGLLAITSGAM